MNKENIQITDLGEEQILSVINKGIDKAKRELDKFIEVDIETMDATFDLAAKVHQMQMMLMAAELSQEMRTFTKFREIQVIADAYDNNIDVDDKDALYEVSKDVIDSQVKYCALNNDNLSALLFEISKDILSEVEFTIAIL
jgi:hypothetical protein